MEHPIHIKEIHKIIVQNSPAFTFFTSSGKDPHFALFILLTSQIITYKN